MPSLSGPTNSKNVPQNAYVHGQLFILYVFRTPSKHGGYVDHLAS